MYWLAYSGDGWSLFCCFQRFRVLCQGQKARCWANVFMQGITKLVLADLALAMGAGKGFLQFIQCHRQKIGEHGTDITTGLHVGEGMQTCCIVMTNLGVQGQSVFQCACQGLPAGEQVLHFHDDALLISARLEPGTSLCEQWVYLAGTRSASRILNRSGVACCGRICQNQ